MSGSAKKFVVRLSSQDRQALGRMCSAGVYPVRMVRRARILVECDQNAGPVPERVVVARRVGVSANTVIGVVKRFVQTGGDVSATIGRKQRPAPPTPAVVTGDVEARLIALACSAPPEGYARWSLRLLEKHVALMEDLPSLDHSTIGRVLKKHHCAGI